jgi:DNA-binding CsgD family transcriptional regulator
MMILDVVMNTDEDKAAVLAVLEAETAAWMRKDLVTLAQHWVQSPQSRRMVSLAHIGTQVHEGWDTILAVFEGLVKQYPQAYGETRVRRERMNIVINGDTAWASYDQVGERTGDNFEMTGTQHELKIFQRIEGQWKIGCIVIMQRTMDHESCPLIEISPDKLVLWMNDAARDQIAGHPTLTVSGGRLRARDRNHEAGLQEGVDWAIGQLHRHLPPSPPSRPARAVVMGESGDAAPIFCWVLIEDGKILVSFNDEQLLKRRIAIAQGMYGLSAAQAQLAKYLAEGHELSVAAGKLGVSINTVRTHLQRMFDRTGTHSQSALVGLLLCAESPTAR